MPKALDVRDYPDIAEALLEVAASVPPDPARWDEAEDARFRSAVNRAYYGLFVYLKVKLEPARKGWTFPERGVHRHLRLALGEALGWTHPVYQAVVLLQRERSRADYEPDVSFSLSEVEGLIDTCNSALCDVQGLSEAELTSTANELFDSVAQLR